MAEAVAFDRTGIVAVGAREDVLAAAGKGAEITRLHGEAVVPGFIDAHHHMSIAVFYEGCVDLGGARSIEDILARLREEARRTTPGEWILGFNYDDALLEEHRHPTREELDAASAEHPIVLCHYSFHEGVASSRALALASIDGSTPSPTGGEIVRRHGVPTGHLVELAMTRVEAMARESRAVRDTEQYLARLARYQDRLFATGITRIVDAMVPPSFEALYRRAKAEGHLRVPVTMLPGSGDGILARPFDRIGEGSRTGEGDDTLRTGPLKLAFDGANRCAMCMSLGRALRTGLRTLASLSIAGLRASRSAAPRFERDATVRTGILYYDVAGVRAIAKKAHAAGLGLAIHAIGNEAIDQAIYAHRVASPIGPWPSRIEHGSFLSQEQVRRIADAGIAIVTQPPFLLLPAVEEATIPSGLKYVRMRSLRDASVCVAASSDAPVTTFDVLAGIRAAVGRRRRNGRVLHEEEAVSVHDALAMYTRDAANASGCLDVAGTIERGKRADLVVLSEDPCAPGARLEQVTVRRTVLAGETVFGA